MEMVTVFISFLSLIVSCYAAHIAKESTKDAKRSADATEESAKLAERSAVAAEKSLTTSVEMFKRQGVIDLFQSWQDIRDINPSNPVTTDVVRAINSLELTASYWNHDIMRKDIIHQSFWDDFKSIYDKINTITSVPGFEKSGNAMLTRRVRKAYKEMDDYDTKKEASSNLI